MHAELHALGEGATLVTFEQRISEDINKRVLALGSALREERIAGVADIVPAYCSLLVQFDPLGTDREDLHARLTQLLSAPLHSDPGVRKMRVIPVAYGGEDGPDLKAVAAACGLSPAQVIAMHSAHEYRVYFVGFMPGFGYMGSVPEQIAVPRQATPRRRVAAGSVGLAGRQTGIYPFASPGGWQILGRTGTSVWDENRPEPALFAAGDTVRFEPTQESPDPPSKALVPPRPLSPVFEVLDPGPLTMLQDLGRSGYGSSGLSAGGALDGIAVVRANALVGNVMGAAVMEMLHRGPTLRALRTTAIAVDGADLGCVIAGYEVPLRTTWLVRAGMQISFRSRVGGGRGWLAVAGGFHAPVVLGSRSTYLMGSFGGFAGRALRAGDVLSTESAPDQLVPAALAGRNWPGYLPAAHLSGVQSLRFVPYNGPNCAPEAAIRTFCAQSWLVSEQSDRVGLRLSPTESPVHGGTGDVLSFGVVRGAIQLPPDGQPIILSADHQTTGGYLVLGVIAQFDWPSLAQLRPGDEVKFRPVTIEEACDALELAHASLNQGVQQLERTPSR